MIIVAPVLVMVGFRVIMMDTRVVWGAYGGPCWSSWVRVFMLDPTVVCNGYGHSLVGYDGWTGDHIDPEVD